MGMRFKRIPRHIGMIPDGNRRWAATRGLPKKDGYEHGIDPAKKAYGDVWDLGIQEVSVYIFTKENSHRPKDQTDAFKAAFSKFLRWVSDKEVSLLVVGDSGSEVFPKELKGFTVPEPDRAEKRRLNFLVNYNWKWDLSVAIEECRGGVPANKDLLECIGSRHVSPIDLVIRWGSRSRLSGFLPVQSAYADIYVVDALWPDYKIQHLHEALGWYERQDITMGG